MFPINATFIVTTHQRWRRTNGRTDRQTTYCLARRRRQSRLWAYLLENVLHRSQFCNRCNDDKPIWSESNLFWMQFNCRSFDKRRTNFGEIHGRPTNSFFN